MLERFFQKIFVAIIAERQAHEVTVTGIKNGKVLFRQHKRFEEGEPSAALLSYIQKFTEQSPLHYIALLNPEVNQGAMTGCSLKDMIEEGDSSGIKMVCRNKKWMIYASLHEVEALKKRYKGIGLDYIFSPFSVIEHFFADKIGGDFALYALAQKDSFSVAFFEKGTLEYAHHYSMHPSQMPIEEIPSGGFSLDMMDDDEEKGIRLDDIETLDDLDIIDELDNLSDIEDLDSLEEIAEFSEDIPTYEEENIREPQGGKELKEQMDRFNDDYRRFELIQRTLSRFYSGEHCHNRFVETVYIADAYGSGTELKRYLEEELFLSVLIRKIDLADEVVSLAKTEGEG